MILMKGKPVADAAKGKIHSLLAELHAKNLRLTLAILVVGDDPPSHAYKDRMVKLADSLNIDTKVICFPDETETSVLLQMIEQLNHDPCITGILPMMPLPAHLDGITIANAIDPEKDVDCLNTRNIGEVYAISGKWAPCTPRAALTLLKHYNIEIAGKHAVVLGRSNVVGKPMANLLLNENATVTLCHSKTKNLAEITRQADILVAAIGKPAFIRSDMVKDGVVIVDIGINQVGNKLVGDVHPDVQEKSAAFTPVPGGIGTVTTAMVVQALLRKYI